MSRMVTQPTAKLTVKSRPLPDFKALAKLQVLVGVPEKTTGRQEKGSPLTNAALVFLHTHGVRGIDMRRIVRAKMNLGATYNAATQMYIHSHGSPLYAIPPRPIIEPAIEAPDNKKAILAQLTLAGRAALDGKKTEAVRFLNLAGQEAVNRVRAWFTDPRNGWPPNAPSTIKRKGSSRPLIDTGQLRRAITYVIRGNQ